MKKREVTIPELSDPRNWVNDKSLTYIRKSWRRAYFREKDIKDSGFDMINFINIFISKTYQLSLVLRESLEIELSL